MSNEIHFSFGGQMAERGGRLCTVERAELARTSGRILDAINITTDALGFQQKPLDQKRIIDLTNNPEELAILACLSRIQVVALTTYANHQLLPPRIISPLSRAVQTINLVYRDVNLASTLANVTTDHLGRPHYFHPEMIRDIAKTAQAASVLVSPTEQIRLSNWGKKILETAYRSLPSGNPTRSLIAVELSLSEFLENASTHRNALIVQFKELARQSKDNPHRVATVATWIAMAGQVKRDQEVELLGTQTFENIVNNHPEFHNMLMKEKIKQSTASFRRRVVRLLTPITTDPKDRTALFNEIMGK